MKRYIAIYTMLLKLSFQSLFAYRANFFNSVLSSIIWSISGIVITVVLTAKTSHVFGWSRNELLVLSTCYNIFFGVFYLFFSRNFAELTNIIHKGELDGYLLRPIDSQFSLTCWQQSFAQLIRIGIGTGFLVYMLSLMHVTVTMMSLLFFFIFLFFGVMILYAVWFIILTITIWFTNLSNLLDFMYSINSVTKYPQEMYRGFSQFLFFALFPLTLALVIPVKALLQKIVFTDVIMLVSTAIALFFFSRFFWRFALRFYTSAGG